MRALWLLLLVAVCLLLINPAEGTSRAGQDGGGGAPQQQWAEFWASELPAGIRALQAVRSQVSWSRYQHLDSADLLKHQHYEPQDTAGLDIALAATLSALAQHTKLAEVQAWIKAQVTAEVLRVLTALQHPHDCSSARKLVCSLNAVGCGFGCQVHHAVHCLAHAVALNRTLILKVDPWHYSPDRDGQETWEELMAPVSSCSTRHLKNPRWQPPIEQDSWLEDQLEVALGVSGSATTFDPPAMPPDVLKAVQLFNSRPDVWWVGVLAAYLMRPSAQSATRHAAVQRGWTSPGAVAVGVHIRRSDKVSWGRASHFHVEDYFSHVERLCDWKLGSGWQQHSRAGGEGPSASTSAGSDTQPQPQAQQHRCVVYLASDDPAVLEEVRQKYPHIAVLVNKAGAETGGVDKRYSLAGLQGIYDDAMLLASTDFHVVTLSSQIGRLAYELAQVNGSDAAVPDKSLDYHSLDSLWYYEGMAPHEFCTTRDFTGPDGLVVRAGQHVSTRPFVIGEGHVRAKLLQEGSKRQVVSLPPALLGPCSSPYKQNLFRSVLPGHMHEPEPAAGATNTAGVPGTVGVSQITVSRKH